MGIVPRLACKVAKASANHPIHVIILTTILASFSYLMIVDEYLPDRFETSSSVNYYHAPGSKDFKKWVPISTNEIDDYPRAEKHTVIPLRFKRIHGNGIPDLENSFHGLSNNERLVIVDSSEAESVLSGLDTFTSEGITWKIRSRNQIYRYLDYVSYAFKKTRSLIQLAETFDVGLITFAYIAMWYTLIKVFFDMKKAGSTFWLAFSTLLSSTFAFLFALVVTTKVLMIKVPILSMTEGLPFLVAIIGFKHKVSISTFVSNASTSQSDVKSIVGDAIYSHFISLFRDHVAVIGALLAIIAYANQLEGLRNFSTLAALILSFDLLMTFTFYSSILTLKVEINRARRTENLKIALEEDGISSWVAKNVASRDSKIDKSEKDSIFRSEHTSILSFKVAMIAGFFGFHAFWLGSNWLYDVASNERTVNRFNDTVQLSKTAAKHIKIGSKGTIVTVLSPKSVVPLSTFVKLEDAILGLYDFVSRLIKDDILSKFILLAFTLSICINAYFLSASRNQVSTTNKLIENEITRPKSQSISLKPKKTFDSSSKDSETLDSETEDTSASDGELEIKAPNKLLPLDECISYLKEGKVTELNNEEVSSLVVAGKLPIYALEKQLADNKRAVVVRRKAIAKIANAPILNTKSLPYDHYDYDRVFGACCESVIGYMPIPVGVAGPLAIDGKSYYIPMATTEGCLVASATRGCKAMNAGGGVETVLTQDGMTRGPCVSFPSLKRTGAAKVWLDSEEGQKAVKKAFNSTSRFARLQHIKTAIAGRLLYIRFKTTTGDAMGMNMISKGVEHSLKIMQEEFGWDDMTVISVSGNYCVDKKPAAINWIEGRGKSVVAEARIPADVVKKVLKSDVDALVEVNITKNLIGSAMAGSIGGFNAQAANLVTAIFLACGQDPAQNVESSNCMTLINNIDGDLQISVTMPCIEVGTIGGGTILEAQSSMLELLGVRGPHPTNPGDNARQLARIIASAVLAAELSLISALAAGHLVQSHMQHNRKGAAPAVASPEKAPLTEDSVQRLKEGAVNCIKS
ncbi:3-hydroxy-3-methylglutaryl-coenzyme A (HMG-CoA) reductase isozyme [Yamadazyma tenuis]|uniref:3-hydroxy-3-methylglutaryl coenzyme A reductase n=1 Tax=Candida tenuis (strain ATCC 10573 / BCRC 21748 / CBS 615 / JCM 9827 / NBRC 10315 / NRRL Y-1498 / VKM Y-70) TaxID=590646 RepID=G3AY61_CANTC|nr:uncharacterized protein CANTEDRAFT_118444 [Yamadazyma tenuis ATCC 10573]EGV65775.1 hypothetical protein CANTEDRAFT_118444 [Yamadazyma tenuis ATCC 10573]WEJ95901.1 3-hydroxy-3-methylglutaryl-coenzyme A (HMG-CoA) reductase isozyme [Yamadazyma tenuis]